MTTAQSSIRAEMARLESRIWDFPAMTPSRERDQLSAHLEAMRARYPQWWEWE